MNTTLNTALNTLTQIENQIASLTSEAEQAKQTATAKEQEARDMRNDIIPVVEKIIEERGLRALTDKRVAQHVVRAFRLRRHDMANLRNLTDELFLGHRNSGAQFQFGGSSANGPEFRVILQGYDTVIPLPDRLPEILTAFGASLKFFTPSPLTPDTKTLITEIRESQDGGWEARDYGSELPSKVYPTFQEAMAEVTNHLRLYFTPEHLVTGTFTLLYR